MSAIEAKEPEDEAKQGHPHYSLHTALLFNQEAYSDVTVNLEGGKSFHCHKIIICNNSEYFAKLCGSGAKFKEKKQATIGLKGDDPGAMETLLHWLYNGDYASVASALTNDTPQWRVHMNVWRAADKYCIPELHKAAFEALEGHCESPDFSTADAAQLLAFMYGTVLSEPASWDEHCFAHCTLRRMLPSLLKEPVFCALVDRDSEVRWEVIAILAGMTSLHCVACGQPFLFETLGNNWSKPLHCAICK